MQGHLGIMVFYLLILIRLLLLPQEEPLLVKSNKDYKRAKLLISQGKLDNIFTHQEMGFNYGMTNTNASIGLGQFKI